jgi:hypothetical protein
MLIKIEHVKMIGKFETLFVKNIDQGKKNCIKTKARFKSRSINIDKKNIKPRFKVMGFQFLSNGQQDLTFRNIH